MVSVLSWAGKRFENRESKAVMLSGYHFQVGNFFLFPVRRVMDNSLSAPLLANQKTEPQLLRKLLRRINFKDLNCMQKAISGFKFSSGHSFDYF